jgi:hypothetical protein
MMLRYTSHTRYLVVLIIMSAFVVPFHITHAQGILDILMRNNSDQPRATSTDNELEKERKEEKKEAKTASSTTETPKQSESVATSTTEQSTATSTNPNPTNTTPKNSALEELLNKIIPPAEVYTPPTTTKPRASVAATTTPKTTSKATSTKATTTPAALTSIPDHTSPSATNYYKPLDALNPTATYGLSAVALAVGSAGALLILRDPTLATRRRNILVRNTFAHAPAFKNPLLDQ